ncbi:hypothetical protein ACHAXR_006746 [Thalassiosira sp. AJA248-18]
MPILKKNMNSIIVLLVLVGTSVESFSTVPPIKGATTTTTTATTLFESVDPTTDQHEGTNFWGSPRNEREIIDFVSDAVFDNEEVASNNSQQPNVQDQWVEVISAEPPLVIVHGFLEHKYCDQIVDATLGPSTISSDDSSSTTSAKHQLKRSTMGAEQEECDHRTSSTAWLHEDRCPLPLRTFATRTAALSGLPPTNMENLQVVRYQPGEEFQLHTDHLDSFNEFDCGGRLCTCLVYLNGSEQSMEASETHTDDNMMGHNIIADREETTFTGGETRFPEFQAAIPPKKGSALFFWNTLERPGSEDYNKNMFLNVDRKLRHAGLPVLSGEKWVANRWIHPRMFGAGLRYDYLTKRIRDDGASEWLYHKLSYIPGGTTGDESGRCIPREGILRIFRSHCSTTCNNATSEYRSNLQNDQYSGTNRQDSRPDYYYQAHRESPECIEFVLPRPLKYNSTVHFVNEVEYDEKPRLVNKFTACIGDINGVQSSHTEEKSKEGQWNLGYHEIVSVREMTTTSCRSRPPMNGHGEDTTSFLRACGARPSDDPRWIRFGHLIGTDFCRMFLKKSLLPMLGPRPTRT